MDEVLDRIVNATGWSKDEAIGKLREFVAETYPELWTEAKEDFANLDEEDAAFALTAFEVVTVRRGGSGGGGKGDEYVGMVVGFAGERDLMRNQRTALIDASGDVSSLLRYGVISGQNTVNVGRAFFRDGRWTVVDHQDSILYAQQGSENEAPEWAIEGKTGVLFALMGANGPKKPYSYKREWLVVVNEKSKFLQEGPLPMMTLECSWDAATVDLRLNVPICFKAESDTAWYDGETMILKAGNIAPQYGLEWVEDNVLGRVEQMFSPEQFLTQFTPYVKDISEVYQYHDDNCRSTNTGREIGPTFLVRGVAEYVDHDGTENEYSDGGFRHSMAITSQSLKREDPDGKIWCDASRKLVNLGAFNVVKNGDVSRFAKGSQIFVLMQSRKYQNNTTGDFDLSFSARNVYASPLRAIVEVSVPEDSGDVGDFSGFRSVGA